MTDVIKPEAFNERFTIRLNVDGHPVERTLSEMTADEVLAAMDWHNHEHDRLLEEFSAFSAMGQALGETGTPPPEMAALPRAELARGLAGLRQSVEAGLKASRLMERVMNMCPPQHHKLPFGSLRRWWPGGRAA
jgi:hypothetical protein